MFIVEAITSILVQDYKNFELIITDNASTDKTERICRAFASSDNRVRYIRNERNLGAAPNFNLGFRLSSGKYFKWCAADDLISANFLSACVEVLEENPDIVLAYGTPQSIDLRGNIIPLVGREMTKHREAEGLALRFCKDLLNRTSWMNFEAFSVIRSDALRKTDLHRSYYGSDQMLISELVLLGKFALVHQAILSNREHPDRSINIRDRQACLEWQDTSAKRKLHAIDYRCRLPHLIDIAVRHRKSVPFSQMVIVILLWLIHRSKNHLSASFRQARFLAARKPTT